MLGYNRLGINGRLGNQMFQYAALRGIAAKHNYDWVIPPLDHTTIPMAEYVLFDGFKMSSVKESNFGFIPQDRPTYDEPSHDFDVNLFNNCPDNINLDGFRQSEKYFKHIEDEIREDFTFKDDIYEPCKEFISQYGDDIIFLGLVPEAYEKAGKDMTVLIDPRLVAMCERSMPGIEFLPAAKGSVQEERFDYHLPMGSLPRLFRGSEEDFSKTRKSYLKADMERVEVLRKELGVEGKKVIGISWRSVGSIYFKKKSLDLEQFGRMFNGLDVVLLNLQYGDVNEEIRAFTKGTGIEVLQCSSVNLKEDLDGLGALIALCDLVVSTSNVTIHMAGAMGKEAWVLLPFAANFWWLIERTDSLWYPTVKLYRQKSLQDWSEILKVVRSDLDQRFENKSYSL